MESEQLPAQGRISTARAVRHHLAVVICCVVLGALGGWFYASSAPATYTSTARVLVDPSVGNPYSPTPASVRQDELTSLETEAQVAGSAEVLRAVADPDSGLTVRDLERGLQVAVPANTQILEISYTSTDRVVAQQVADAVASAYLNNRVRRFDKVNASRIERVETRTLIVVTELREATAAAQVGSPADRAFQGQLADALRNELVNLRAQRTALENSESPAGAVIAPASSPKSTGALTAMLMPAAGALVGLAIGCLLAVLLERLSGVVRSARDVEAAGLPVAAAVPAPGWRARLSRRRRAVAAQAMDVTIRRLRATILDLEPRPEVIAVAPAGDGDSDAGVSEEVAASFAKAGHRVVLVRTDGDPATSGLGIEERGLAQALLYDRLNVLDLLQPSVDPLLCLLPGGFTDQSRELLVADRLRAVLSPLIEAGHLVVIQSPGIDTADGEAFVGAADLGLVVVTVGRTRPHEVEHVMKQGRTRRAALGALVVGPRGHTRRAARAARSSIVLRVDDAGAVGRDDVDLDARQEEARARDSRRRAPR